MRLPDGCGDADWSMWGGSLEGVQRLSVGYGKVVWKVCKD